MFFFCCFQSNTKCHKLTSIIIIINNVFFCKLAKKNGLHSMNIHIIDQHANQLSVIKYGTAEATVTKKNIEMNVCYKISKYTTNPSIEYLKRKTALSHNSGCIRSIRISFSI